MDEKAELEEFIGQMEMLLDLKVDSKETLKNWYDLAYDIEDKFYVNKLHNVVPEFVIHYLSDADIRLKDPEYALSQNKEMRVVIEGLKDQ